MPETNPLLREDVYTLESGEIVVQWPRRGISASEVEDVSAWFQMVARKIERTVKDSGAAAGERE